MDKKNVAIIELSNLKFKVDLQGFNANYDKTTSLAHSHANYEFHILLKNNAVLDIEDCTVPLEHNDAVLLFPGIFHKFKKQEEHSSILSFNFFIEIHNGKCGTDHYSMLLQQIEQQNGYLIIKQNMQITDYIKKIVTNINLDNPFSKDTVKALLVLLFSEIFLPFYNKNTLRNDAQAELSESDSRIYMIESYFNDHYMEDISLSKLSKLLCLSEMQTNRMIRKAFGMEFRECLFKIRMKSAKKLLRETEMSVKAIAESVGYQSYNGFYLAFKNKFGITPLDYRAQFIPQNT